MKFKIGQMVSVDTVNGPTRAARIESINEHARRARILYIDTGERREAVPFGDIALIGERMRWSPGDAPPGAIGIDYSNPDHHEKLARHFRSEEADRRDQLDI